MDAITARECVMGRIAKQIRAHGYFFADLDPNAPQALVDLRWAAQMAGRQIGCRVETYASAAGRCVPMKITVVVAPLGPSPDGPGLDAPVRSILEDVLQLKVSDRTTLRSA
jgi:hypothetical protein